MNPMLSGPELFNGSIRGLKGDCYVYCIICSFMNIAILYGLELGVKNWSRLKL
jgi:hypothetical protein